AGGDRAAAARVPRARALPAAADLRACPRRLRCGEARVGQRKQDGAERARSHRRRARGGAARADVRSRPHPPRPVRRRRAVAAVVVARPWGLLGRPEAQGRSAGGSIIAGREVAVPRALIVGLAALLLAIPPLLPTFYVWVLVEILAFALFAASLHLLMGTGGMVSFGHAAAFGMGAYGAALLVRWVKAPMLLALAAAPLAAAATAVVIGFFCVRLSS